MIVSIKVIEVLFNNHSFITFHLFIYLLLILWHFSGTHVRTCVQVATPLWDQTIAGGGWTVFQKRRDGFVDFYRTWDAYKRGFGNLNGEFWLGLDKIHRLAVSSSNRLRVDLEDLQGSTAFAEYSSFTVASERAKYQLSLGSYSGTINAILSST